MPWIPAVVGGATALIGGSQAKKGAQSAADQQAAAAGRAAQASAAERAPWLQAGQQGLNTLQSGLSPGGQFTQKFSMADAANSPAEQFAQQRGAESIQNSAAAKSGLLNSNTMRSLTDNAEKTAVQFEGQAFDQWLEQQRTALSANQSLAGLGMTEANLNAGDRGNSILAAGGAQAGASAAAGNINAGVANNIGGNIAGMLGGLLGGGSGAGGGGGAPLTVDAYGQGIGSGVGGVSGATYDTGVSAAGDFSDERLKEDVIQVGTTNDGLPIYKYRMKGGGKTQMGVMAQDVERVRPSAVSTHPSGYKMVDYNRVS